MTAPAWALAVVGCCAARQAGGGVDLWPMPASVSRGARTPPLPHPSRHSTGGAQLGVLPEVWTSNASVDEHDIAGSGKKDIAEVISNNLGFPPSCSTEAWSSFADSPLFLAAGCGLALSICILQKVDEGLIYYDTIYMLMEGTQQHILEKNRGLLSSKVVRGCHPMVFLQHRHCRP